MRNDVACFFDKDEEFCAILTNKDCDDCAFFKTPSQYAEGRLKMLVLECGINHYSARQEDILREKLQHMAKTNTIEQ